VSAPSRLVVRGPDRRYDDGALRFDVNAHTILASSRLDAKSRETQEERLLLGLPFDHYARYALTRQIIGDIRATEPDRIYRILDVGGHSSPLKYFLPNNSITLLDVEPIGSLTSVEFLYDEYVRGSGAALPFREGAFDIVTAHDTVEHVPSGLRSSLLAEMSRVASGFLVIAGPVSQPDVERAEVRLNSFVRSVLGWDQPFLKEHIELGLPTKESIEDFLQSESLSFVRIPNGNLGRWLAMQGLRHYLAALPDTEDLREALDATYNRLISERDFDGVCYRQAYVAAKSASGSAALNALSRRFPAPEDASASAQLESLEEMLAAMEVNAASIRSRLSDLHAKIYQAQSEAFELRAEKDRLAAVVIAREGEVSQKEELVQSLDTELRRIQETLGYRLLQDYRSFAKRAFPAGSLRAIPYRGLRKGVHALTARKKKRQ
jgi:hypothetical protein